MYMAQASTSRTSRHGICSSRWWWIGLIDLTGMVIHLSQPAPRRDMGPIHAPNERGKNLVQLKFSQNQNLAKKKCCLNCGQTKFWWTIFLPSDYPRFTLDFISVIIFFLLVLTNIDSKLNNCQFSSVLPKFDVIHVGNKANKSKFVSRHMQIEGAGSWARNVPFTHRPCMVSLPRMFAIGT